MDLSHYETMDANILLGVINEKLRLECSDLEDLSLYFGISQQGLERKLNTIDYHYDETSNQFKSF